MKILVLKEINENESRVALTPELVSRYIKIGFEVFVENDSGKKSGFENDEYEKEGAKLAQKIDDILPEIDIIISVSNSQFNVAKIKENLILISLLNPHFNQENVAKLKNAKIQAFALEMTPRITRAQGVDVLSSQSNLAGYSAVIESLNHLKKCVPMMMTAAGTVSAAKFLILGAGVAGLQAIATAKRLGGIVSAFDVRSAAKEQVMSLGAKFIEVKVALGAENGLETKAGYASEATEEYKQKQQKLLEETIVNQDVIISTALIPGKKAPILITKTMVEKMKKTAVIIDLAASNGGNCELTELNKIVDKNGVKIVGYENCLQKVATDASKLFAKNIFNFIELIVDKENKNIKIDLDDEIIASTLLK